MNYFEFTNIFDLDFTQDIKWSEYDGLLTQSKSQALQRALTSPSYCYISKNTLYDASQIEQYIENFRFYNQPIHAYQLTPVKTEPLLIELDEGLFIKSVNTDLEINVGENLNTDINNPDRNDYVKIFEYNSNGVIFNNDDFSNLLDGTIENITNLTLGERWKREIKCSNYEFTLEIYFPKENELYATFKRGFRLIKDNENYQDAYNGDYVIITPDSQIYILSEKIFQLYFQPYAHPLVKADPDDSTSTEMLYVDIKGVEDKTIFATSQGADYLFQAVCYTLGFLKYTWILKLPSGEEIILPDQAENQFITRTAGEYYLQLTIIDENGINYSSPSKTFIVSEEPIIQLLNEKIYFPNQQYINFKASIAVNDDVLYTWKLLRIPDANQTTLSTAASTLTIVNKDAEEKAYWNIPQEIDYLGEYLLQLQLKGNEFITTSQQSFFLCANYLQTQITPLQNQTSIPLLFDATFSKGLLKAVSFNKTSGINSFRWLITYYHNVFYFHVILNEESPLFYTAEWNLKKITTQIVDEQSLQTFIDLPLKEQSFNIALLEKYTVNDPENQISYEYQITVNLKKKQQAGNFSTINFILQNDWMVIFERDSSDNVSVLKRIYLKSQEQYFWGLSCNEYENEGFQPINLTDSSTPFFYYTHHQGGSLKVNLLINDHLGRQDQIEKTFEIINNPPKAFIMKVEDCFAQDNLRINFNATDSSFKTGCIYYWELNIPAKNLRLELKNTNTLTPYCLLSLDQQPAAYNVNDPKNYPGKFTYQISLTIQNPDGAYDTTSSQFNVWAAPQAIISSVLNGYTEEQQIYFEGKNSFGKPTINSPYKLPFYLWTIKSSLETITIRNQASFLYKLPAGEYSVTLKVKDDFGKIAFTEKTFQIFAKPKVVIYKVIKPTGQSVQYQTNDAWECFEGETVIFDGSASSSQISKIQKYSWELFQKTDDTNFTKLKFKFPAESKIQYTFLEAGDYRIALTVQDLNQVAINKYIDFEVNTAATPKANVIIERDHQAPGFLFFNPIGSYGAMPLQYQWELYEENNPLEQIDLQPWKTTSITTLEPLNLSTTKYTLLLKITDAYQNQAHQLITFQTVPEPVNFNAEVTNLTIKLSWGDSNINVTSWELYENNQLIERFLDPKVTTYDITKIEAATYTYYIKAINHYGETKSDVIEVETVLEEEN